LKDYDRLRNGSSKGFSSRKKKLKKQDLSNAIYKPAKTHASSQKNLSKSLQSQNFEWKKLFYGEK
jgi:hypothetical protein